jgi:hypothetical protein
LQVQTNFDTKINRQQAPFSGTIAGEQVIKIQCSLRLLIFSVFSLDFSSASLNFDHQLTVNFRQPRHEFTFNVGIDLLF